MKPFPQAIGPGGNFLTTNSGKDSLISNTTNPQSHRTTGDAQMQNT